MVAWRLRSWLVLVLLVLAPRAALAIVVLERGSEQPIMGYLIRQSDQSLVIRQELPGGQTREVTIPKSRVEELIVTVSPERLTALDPARPEEYREYAEELAEKRRDPEAAGTARRLFAIAAHRGDKTLRHSALLGLAALAKSSDEERRLRALGYLYDPRRDESVLQVPHAQVGETGDDAAAELLSALRLIRQGKPAAARAILEQPAVKRRLADNSPISTEEVTALASSAPLTDEQLAEVLRAEMALESASHAGQPMNRAANWSLAGARSLAPMPVLKLEKLTEFDPAECVYRDGRWMRP